MIDPFFEPHHESEWNACVGSQGSEEAYVDGYIEAAITLVSAVIENNEDVKSDILAMPILFNGRHALELSLKFVTSRLCEANVLPSQNQVDHDISSYLSRLSDAKIGDKKIRTALSDLRPFVESLAKIDPDGQQFRYAKTRNGEISLQNMATVDLLLVKESLLDLRQKLAKLRDCVEEYIQDRQTGTFTQECSRRELREILMILGNYSTWINDDFVTRKGHVCARFNLTGRQFSKAVDKIKSSRELGALVGIERDLIHISDEKVVNALGKWSELNSFRREKSDSDHFDFPDFNQLQEYLTKKQNLREFIASLLTIDELSDLCSLFYLGRDSRYGELYEFILSYTKTQFHSETYDSHIDYLMSKATLLRHVIVGVKLAGRPSLARALQGISSDSETA
jgi:hypothetical protein